MASAPGLHKAKEWPWLFGSRYVLSVVVSQPQARTIVKYVKKQRVLHICQG